jgi:hypothetical protein
VDGYRKRHRGNRVGETVLLWQFVGATAHQVKRRGAADVLSRAVRQGEHARLRDDPRQRDHGIPAGRALGESCPAGRPGREVPARAVPHRHHPGTVHRQRSEQVDPGGHVLERPGPAPSGERPPVLQVPRGVPAPREVRRQGPPKRQVTNRPPEPAVNNHDGPLGRPVRQRQLTKLIRLRPVPVDNRCLLRRRSTHAAPFVPARPLVNKNFASRELVIRVFDIGPGVQPPVDVV